MPLLPLALLLLLLLLLLLQQFQRLLLQPQLQPKFRLLLQAVDIEGGESRGCTPCH